MFPGPDSAILPTERKVTCSLNPSLHFSLFVTLLNKTSSNAAFSRKNSKLNLVSQCQRVKYFCKYLFPTKIRGLLRVASVSYSCLYPSPVMPTMCLALVFSQ